MIVSEETINVMNRKKEEGASLWRVSSTLFSAIASDHLLQPLDKYRNATTLEKYPPILTGHQVTLYNDFDNTRVFSEFSMSLKLNFIGRKRVEDD